MPEISLQAVTTYCDVVWPERPEPRTIALRGLPEKRGNEEPYLIWLRVESGNRERLYRGVFDFVRNCTIRGLASYCIPGFVLGRAAGNVDVVEIPSLLIDLDNGKIADKAMRASSILGPPTMAIRSGGLTPSGEAKSHLYWALSGDTSAGRVCELREHAARLFGGDRVFGPGRAHQPVRIAGSLHRKGEPRLVEILYGSANVLDVDEVKRRLENLATRLSPTGSPGAMNGGPVIADRPEPNVLGLSRRISLDQLITRRVVHGDPEINRFETLTRMIGMFLSNLHDAQDDDECVREFGFFRQWAVGHIENVERDYDLRLHWKRLLRRERWKRAQPRAPRARPVYMRRP